MARIERAGLRGLVACVENLTQADGRGLFAVLMYEGLEALRRTWPAYVRGMAERFRGHLTDEETRVLAHALSKVLATAQED